MADTYEVQRAATIQAPAERVYGHLVDFHAWQAWSPWEEIDPAMERRYEGPESGVGAAYAWSGNRRAGQGRMEILEAVEPSSVKVALHLEKPFRSENTTTFTLTPDGEGTHVVWWMSGPASVFTRVMGIFRSMDKMIGPDFEKGLARLRSVSEGPRT